MLCQQPKGWMNTTKNHKTNLKSHLTIRKACLLSAAVNLVPIVAVEDSEGEQGHLYTHVYSPRAQCTAAMVDGGMDLQKGHVFGQLQFGQLQHTLS